MDPDPAIFIRDLQNVNKFFFYVIFAKYVLF